MSGSTELLITSDASASLCSSSIWNTNTGTSIHSYKGGGAITPGTINLIGNDYLIAAERLKPLLHVWPINSQETIKYSRFVCPGKVQALAISSNSSYCAAGIEEKLYIWQIASGRLLSVASKHFQHITKVLFTSDCSYVITSGEDGLVFVWPLANLISQQSNDYVTQTTAGQTDPLYTFSDHSMPVKDMCVGKTGTHARLVTVSTDRTMKIYQLISGTLLLSVVFDVCLTAVTMNLSESKIYTGGVDGLIYELSLLNPPRNREYHVNKSEISVFKGHTKSITTLSVSVDGQTLASGSTDEQVIIWHIQTRQKLRNLQHKGAVTNAFFMITPQNLFVHDLKPTVLLSTFQRAIDDDSNYTVDIIHNKDIQLPFLTERTAQVVTKHTPTTVESNDSSKKEVEKLKAINSKLYQFTLNKIFERNSQNEIPNVKKGKNKRKRV